jgi:hypothetical protein
MVGHMAGFVAGYMFREDNAASAAENLEFLRACEGAVPKRSRRPR